MEINVVEIEELRVAGLPHHGAYGKIGPSFMKLHDLVKESEIQAAPLVGIYYDDPHSVPEDKLRSVAGIIVQQDANVPAGLEETNIPGGKYAMASIVGPYSKLPKAWEDFYIQGIGPAGLKTKADLCFERYLNTPGEAKEEDLITELYAPLA
jgi:AraC family transcriptional regulator